MIDYNSDPQVIGYRMTINNCEIQISLHNNRIAELKKDIEELSNLRIMVKKVENKVTVAKNDTLSGLAKLPLAIINPTSILNMNFFSSILNAVKQTSPTNYTNDSIKSIDNQIQKINDEIAELRKEIKQLETKIRMTNISLSQYTPTITKNDNIIY